MALSTRATSLRSARLLTVVWLVLPRLAAAAVPPPLAFFSVTPCRVVDTRLVGGGGPLVAGIERTFPFAGVCGISSTAAAVSINVAVTQPTAAGNVRLYPAGSPVPASSTINYAAGQTRTNNTIVGLGAAGALAARNQPAGSTHLIVDVNGYFEEPPPVCGNGVVEAGEECDDGNTASGDGCSAVCQIEVCGNGIIDAGETCDDGNTTSGDGCSAVCQIEVCGNGIIDAGEACDDGDVTSGDGCSAVCMVEIGWTCQGAPSSCFTTCGDGITAGIEECDDGNTTSGDGCSATCMLEP